MESVAHRRLKTIAAAHLRGDGCVAVATEVQCPIARYRLDVVGYRDQPATVVVECKASRADFLRDTRRLERLLAVRTGLERIREAIERDRIRVEEPHLRRSDSALFPEFEEWDYTSSRLGCYRRILARLERIDRKLHGETKFHHMARWMLADRLYLAAPRGMIKRAELPPGWGLLEAPRRWIDGERDDPIPTMVESVEAPERAASTRHRQRLLRNIAVAASRGS